MFKKSDLKLGDVVVDRRGVPALAVKVHSDHDMILLSDQGYMPMSCFGDDLLCNGGSHDPDFDIMKVYRSYSGWGHGFQQKMRRLMEREALQHTCIFDRNDRITVEIDGKTYALGDVKRALAHEDVKSLEEEEDDNGF